jgi:hypothetical protein
MSFWTNIFKSPIDYLLTETGVDFLLLETSAQIVLEQTGQSQAAWTTPNKN